jgi:hypothetical protein
MAKDPDETRWRQIDEALSHVRRILEEADRAIAESCATMAMRPSVLQAEPTSDRSQANAKPDQRAAKG